MIQVWSIGSSVYRYGVWSLGMSYRYGVYSEEISGLSAMTSQYKNGRHIGGTLSTDAYGENFLISYNLLEKE